MRTNITETQARLNLAQTFLDKYSAALEKSDAMLNVEASMLFATQDDAALLGTVFGKSGWTRELSYDGTSFHWIKTVDGISIRIANVEDMELNNTPVPEKAFPILLNE